MTSEPAKSKHRTAHLINRPSDPQLAADTDRIFTIPNIMSIVRLMCIPLFLYLLFGRDNRAGAAWLMGGLGATDWIDGYIARRYNQISELGKILDPTADRLLFIVGIVGILIKGVSPVWFFWLVLVRETLFGGVVAIATAFGMKRFDVSWWGKLATALMMLAIPGFLLGSADDFSAHTGFKAAAWVFGLPGLVISYVTAIIYVPVIRRNLREGRAERHIKGVQV